ncbi:hypothetical protein J5S49_09620 [Virgibacillus halodenitrificans]|jgi:hypothetical protein|uniref:hypothetical protein n=1 Tax=Virgibacillus halodenitrificans TaxID=1482 RepID=UPI001F3157E0|nr:hypothetical protein [Virgibacillus halodenitrificans]MCG1028550.1 hypothetical protein [Virgibacillus halodenitrificans]
MKKIFILFAMLLALVLTACGQTQNNTDSSNGGDTSADETAEKKDDGENDEAAIKKALLSNYLNVAKTVRPYQTKINMYVESVNNPETEATIETTKEDAITAAEEAVTAIEGIKVEDLDEDKAATFNDALTELKGAYEAYAKALGEEEIDVAAAEEKINATNEKLTPVFEDAGLHAPNLAKEIN